MLSQEMWQFACIDFLYGALEPLTPYGKLRIDQRRIWTSQGDLQRQYDLIEAAAGLLDGDAGKLDKITYHLKRICMLDEPAPDQPFSAPEIFLVKKFLVNYRAVCRLVEGGVGEAFALSFDLDDLLKRLDVEDGGGETFYVSDRYCRELADLRRQIRHKDQQIQQVKSEVNKRLLGRYGLDFGSRDFLVLASHAAATMDRREVFLEPHDSSNVVVKPVMGQEYFDLVAQRERLIVQERLIERRVLCELSAEIEERLAAIRTCTERIEQFDVSLANARLQRRFGLSRPVIRQAGRRLCVRNGRFLPLEDRCRSEQLKYWPLNVTCDKAATVIHGSNMCGKTVVLQTMAFLQLAAQLGLFVPAESFETVVFERLSYVGGNPQESPGGLSSFAGEIVSLIEAISQNGPNRMLFIDEFARTTNSREAVGLLAGLLAWLNGQDGISALMATHYQRLPRLGNLGYYRMKGLRWDDLARQSAGEVAGSLAQRIHTIHRYVEYEVELDTQGKQVYDAIRVAEVLGLDRRIVELAEKYAAQASD